MECDGYAGTCRSGGLFGMEGWGGGVMDENEDEDGDGATRSSESYVGIALSYPHALWLYRIAYHINQPRVSK